MPLMAADDTFRTARLLLDPELVSGRLEGREATAPAVLAAVTARPQRLRRGRLTGALGMKFGWVDGIAASLGPTLAVRHAALGGDARGAPRFVVRVDEFPSAGSSHSPDQYGLDTFRRFHQVLRREGIPYLLAVVSELAFDYLQPRRVGTRELADDEIAVLHEISTEGVVFAQHGTTHRTRYGKPHRHSELSGLAPDELATLLDEGNRKLAHVGIHPRVLAPPFNRFDRANWRVLAERFSVITGGPESVRIVGLRPGLSWQQGAVYMPSYPPLYGRASSMVPAVERLIDCRPGTWVSIVLHLSWEADDRFRGMEKLAALIGPHAASWLEILAAVDRSSGSAAAASDPVGQGHVPD
jgi:hypothetical protein